MLSIKLQKKKERKKEKKLNKKRDLTSTNLSRSWRGIGRLDSII